MRKVGRPIPQITDGFVVATDPKAVLKIGEVAKLLRLGVNTTYRAVHAGDIPSVKVGGQYLIPVAALNKYLVDCYKVKES